MNNRMFAALALVFSMACGSMACGGYEYAEEDETQSEVAARGGRPGNEEESDHRDAEPFFHANLPAPCRGLSTLGERKENRFPVATMTGPGPSPSRGGEPRLSGAWS